jgi:hypothetical protein
VASELAFAMASNPRLENLAHSAVDSGSSNRSSVSSNGFFNGTPSIASKSSPNVWTGAMHTPQTMMQDSTSQPLALTDTPSSRHSTYESKFQYGINEAPFSAAISYETTLGQRNGPNSVASSSFPLYEPAPVSLPIKLVTTQSHTSYTSSSSSNAPLSASSQSISALNASSTSAPAGYTYDAFSSNVILPRGTIKSSTPILANAQHVSRSSSTPVSLQTVPRSSSVGTLEIGSTKLEKTRKPKKINTSSLPAPPPSSSVASVPMADGNAPIAELIADRWPDALYQGWMKKRNKGKESTAKKRYLVVKTNCIEYYSDPTVRQTRWTGFGFFFVFFFVLSIFH